MNEFELSIEVPMTIKVKFSVEPYSPATWGYHGGDPGCRAHVDDIQFVLISKEYPDKEVETPVECGYMHDAILAALSSDEWEELCFDQIEEDEVDRKISRYQDSLDDPHLEARLGGNR